MSLDEFWGVMYTPQQPPQRNVCVTQQADSTVGVGSARACRFGLKTVCYRHSKLLLTRYASPSATKSASNESRSRFLPAPFGA